MIDTRTNTNADMYSNISIYVWVVLRSGMWYVLISIICIGIGVINLINPYPVWCESENPT